MNQDIRVDSVRSESSGTIGRSLNKGHEATLLLDSSGRPQPDAFTNPEAFLAGVSSCSVTLIEMHAQENGVPLKRMAVTINASRDPAVSHYQSVHMHFEMAGVSQVQAEDLVKNYQGRCSLYGTLSRAVKITADVAVVGGLIPHMPYDLLIKNGRVIDGSGAPAFRADVGIRNGKIVAIGKLRGAATRTVDADGLVVAPGFLDTHCHYDAQVTWDPLCSFSCYHGATTVIIGNCSMALAPVRRGAEYRLAEFLSYVEAIPMDVLKTVNVNWETVSEYMTVLDERLGVNVGNLIGHTAVRHYVMGDESQGRAATAEEIESMRAVVREGIEAGALGLSLNRNKGHFDPQGVNIPAVWAREDEIFALADVLGELGTGIIQSGAGRDPKTHELMTRLSVASGRQVVYNNLVKSSKQPDAWKEHIARVDKTTKAGVRANPMCTPNVHTIRFTMRNSQVFRGVPTWHPILIAPDEEKLRAYSDPAVRKKLHEEVVEWALGDIPDSTLQRTWYDTFWVGETMLPKNKGLHGKSLRELAQAQGKGIIDALLDLVVEENLDTVFLRGSADNDKEAMATILNYPHAYLGLSDGGAHVQFQSGYGYSSRLLGYWVREQGIMSLEQAVKRLTFESASVFGIYDRGLLRPGLAADIVIFDPATINPLPEDVVHDFPAGAWRIRELAAGVHYTIVNGEVLIEEGHHTGALPGRILRNSLYHERAGR